MGTWTKGTKRSCLNCGTKFEVLQSAQHQIYCSDYCSSRYRTKEKRTSMWHFNRREDVKEIKKQIIDLNKKLKEIKQEHQIKESVKNEKVNFNV